MRTDTTVDTSGARIEVAHKGDGTGTRTTFDADGTETDVEQLTGLPVPALAVEDAAARALKGDLATATTIAGVRSALTRYADTLTDQGDPPE